MMPWFIWKGKNSLSDYGIWISRLPKRVRSEERHEEIEVPGRAGSLLMLEGEDIYSSYSAEMSIVCRNDINVDKVIEWLRGTSDLILITDTEKTRRARIVGEVAFERDGNCLLTATIPFVFQPFRRNRLPEKDRVQITASTGSFTNPGDVASKPIVSITGSGNNTVTMAGIAISFTGISGTIVVDCETELITAGDQIWTGTFNTLDGEFWKLPKGEITVTQTGNMEITVDPNWRWL